MSAIISLNKISVVREGKTILRQVSWTTRPGEHWFVMGANGSGKTTLMEVLAGYQWATRGQVAVAGGVFGRTSIPELRKHVGYVSPWIFRRMPPETPAEDVVASGFEGSVGLMAPCPAPQMSVAHAALGSRGCRNLARRCFGTLSSGEQLKVILARALVNSPAVLILDEPFSVLDVAARAEMYRDLTRAAGHRDAPQVILITHHFEDILPFFTHGLLLNKGRVAAQGPRMDILRPRVIGHALGIAPGLLPSLGGGTGLKKP
jgi:iron complex transport system ATP-binding protein